MTDTALLTRADVAQAFLLASTASGRTPKTLASAAPAVQGCAWLMGDLLNHYRETMGRDPLAVQLAAATMDASVRLGYAGKAWSTAQAAFMDADPTTAERQYIALAAELIRLKPAAVPA